jgi:carboxymethylenebutenolidase
MRFARFITSGSEEDGIMSAEPQPHGALGVVLAGIPSGDRSTIEVYTTRGYEVVAVDVHDGTAVDAGLDAVRSAMTSLAKRVPGAKIAVVGYGFGGRYAYLAVTRLGADGAAALYGAGIGDYLGEASRAKLPLTFHFGDDDEFVPIDEIRRIKGALEGFATTEIYRYPGVGHGFALRGHAGYDEAAAIAAEQRVFAILDTLRN